MRDVIAAIAAASLVVMLIYKSFTSGFIPINGVRQMLDRLYKWCYNAETIIWARTQVAFGVLYAMFFIAWPVVSGTDVTPLIKDPRWVPVWAIFNGVVSEVLRRYKSEFSDGHLRPVDDGSLPLDPGKP